MYVIYITHINTDILQKKYTEKFLHAHQYQYYKTDLNIKNNINHKNI